VQSGCKKQLVIRKRDYKAAGGRDKISKRFAGWKRKNVTK
jgi:hypothetical protein